MELSARMEGVTCKPISVDRVFKLLEKKGLAEFRNNACYEKVAVRYVQFGGKSTEMQLLVQPLPSIAGFCKSLHLRT